jgi:Phosphotransferase enzyme family
MAQIQWQTSARNRPLTLDDELVDQEIRQPALGEGGREVILSLVDDATSIDEVKRLAGGRGSRTAERILVTTRSGTRPVVLKRFPADRAGAAAEWRALTAVEHFPVPSPPPLFLDHDGACFGDPAVVMGALPGTVLGEVPRGVTWLRRATAAMARLHAVPLSTVPAGIPAWPRLLDRRDSLDQARAHLGDEQLERAYAQGMALSLEKALDLALPKAGPA